MNEIVTADRRMKELIQLARQVAPSKATVLIQGESGTGKELMACLIHECSQRAQKPFVAINCAAIPENLLESELFGYERGAFTGAVASKAGRFEFANGGTLLLDEISEIDVRLQAKLLRVIQEGEVDRIGGRKPVPVDVRILATTNRNLGDCVKAGTFREDLFYRLNVVNLTLPPLRERPGDISLLANAIAQFYGEKNGRPELRVHPEAIRMLERYNWPGNIRELENVIERAVITTHGSEIIGSQIQFEGRDISRPFSTQQPSVFRDLTHSAENGPKEVADTPWKPGRTLGDIERHVIIEALKYHNGNRTHTARALGISIRTLRNKIAEYRQSGIYL